jgi:hypothetical protein
VDCDGAGPRLLERHSDAKRNQRLILDDEDGMTGKPGALHAASPARLRDLPEIVALLEEWPLVSSRRSILKNGATSVMIDAKGPARVALAGFGAAWCR